MYGRNGVDQLCLALLLLEGAVYLLCFFFYRGFAGAALRLLALLLTAAFFFRLLSRNLDRRRAENARFLFWFGPRLGGLRDWFGRRADRAHCYSRCVCGAWCRVPRGVGKVELICPRCGKKHIIKT